VISGPGREFVEEFEKLVERIERLEQVVRLFLAPILPHELMLLRTEPFEQYLADRCRDDEATWQRGTYTGYYTHIKTNMEVNISGPPWESQEKLLDALLTIAAAEGRMPARVLADIQPDVFPSAVDHLAAIADESFE